MAQGQGHVTVATLDEPCLKSSLEIPLTSLAALRQHALRKFEDDHKRAGCKVQTCKYMDDDGDRITISTEPEFDEALRQSANLFFVQVDAGAKLQALDPVEETERSARLECKLRGTYVALAEACHHTARPPGLNPADIMAMSADALERFEPQVLISALCGQRLPTHLSASPHIFVRVESDNNPGCNFKLRRNTPLSKLAEKARAQLAIKEEIDLVINGSVLSPSITPMEAGLSDGAIIRASPCPVKPSQPCLGCKFIADITIPDGAVLEPEKSLVKRWKISNPGPPWGEHVRFELVSVSGPGAWSPPSVMNTEKLKEGETCIVEVSFDTPALPVCQKSFRAVYQLTDNGVRICSGSRLWMEFTVEPLEDSEESDFIFVSSD